MTEQISPLPTQTHSHTSPSTNPPTMHRFSFHGDGTSYFQIWIVNLLLTIITLGIYAPWAKVRRLRYFYGNTQIDGRGFDFTANPKRILMGRLIALGLYAAISIFDVFLPTVALAGLLFILIAMPWIIRSTMRFMARNSQYNNVHFGFGGGLGKLYLIAIGTFLMSVLSAGLLSPLGFWLFKRYQFDNTYFGRLKFGFHSTILDFYKALCLPMLLLALMVIGMFTIITGMFFDEIVDDMIIMVMAAFYVALLFIIPVIKGFLHQIVWGKLTLGDNQFKLVNFSILKFSFIHLTNQIVIVLSLGLLYPWAVVRMHRYKVQTLCFMAVDDFERLTTPHADNISPVGEEISDVFDLDVSW
ncbi:YjgN family protein [Moraxella sp. Tifton1]|uniref:YjgN family protein n=1 Tax=Moraxella oculi TaxID=2940516 RepID=UPI0020134641|nr:YjgN family protein [Moraxella sp. Tifton1]MCL1624144.1 YjgN family protein [Moraxella sp. Tifton1]